MHTQRSWQRWFRGLQKKARRGSSRSAVRGVEALERRDLLSAVVGASSTNEIDPLSSDIAALVSSKAKGGGGAGGSTTTPHYTYETMKQQLIAWSAQYGAGNGDLVTLERIGEGTQAYSGSQGETKRGLWAIKISDHASLADDGGVANSEPDLKYIGTIHGNEPLGMELNMRFVNELLTNYGTDTAITNLVSNNEIWVLPLMNPDGFAAPVPQRDNYGGYDLNRSFPELAPLNPYAATKPDLLTLVDTLPKANGGVPEVQAVMEWSADHDFMLAANFHQGSLVVNYPFDNDGTTTKAHYATSPDDGLYKDLATIYASNNPYMTKSSTFVTVNDGVRVRGITNGAKWFVITGGMQDFDYRYFNTKHVTVELNPAYGYGTTKKPIDVDQQWTYNKASMLAYLEQGIELVHPTPPLVASGTTATTAALPTTAAQPVVLSNAVAQVSPAQTVPATVGQSVSQQTKVKPRAVGSAPDEFALTDAVFAGLGALTVV